MSTAVMKTVDVINKCNACIATIDDRRAAGDEQDRLRKIKELRKSDRFWNRITFGWSQIRSEEQLRIDAHNYLQDSDGGWGWYPDTISSGKWRSKAITLKRLAENSCLDVMHIDEEGSVVINWT